MNLNPNKSANRPSSEAIKPSHTGDTEIGKDDQQRMDRAAMDSATRAGSRIKDQDQKSPDSKLFTK